MDRPGLPLLLDASQLVLTLPIPFFNPTFSGYWLPPGFHL